MTPQRPKINTRLIKAAEAKVELLKRQAWNDLYVFTKFVCGRDLLEEQPHKELCEFLMAGIELSTQLNLGFNYPWAHGSIRDKCKKYLNKLIMLPRGTFKSTICTNAFPLWLLWHNPDLRIMIDSETLANAKLYLAGVKDMIENSPLLKVICTDEEGNYLLEPNKGIAGGFTEEQIIMKHRKKVGLKEPSLFCAGVDNARTGMHPDVIIMDDLVSERNVGTDQQIAKVKDHYRFSLSLLEPGGLHVVIGTRYHMADLYGELIEIGSFDNLVRPAIDENNQLYFPTRLGFDRLDQLRKDQGSYIFSCQYMLSPIDDGESAFKRDNIQYIDSLPPDKRLKIINKYIMIDLAISEKETADYTVVLCCGEDIYKNIYILEYDRGHYLPKQTIDAIFNMYIKHQNKVKAVGIETVAFQKAMLYLIKDEMKRRGIYMPIKELKADRDKQRRIRSLQPLFENKQMFMYRNMIELEKELLEFPFSKHDDIIDALAYILQLLRPGSINTKSKEYKYKASNNYVSY